MERDKLIGLLKSLAHLDIDAWHAYDQCIGKLEDAAGTREEFSKSREDHRRHVTELAAKLRDLGEEPPDFSPTFKGYLIEGFTAMRSVTGVQGVLAAMRTNENLTGRKYAEALKEPAIPSDIRPLLEANYEDERRHLRFIEEKLDTWVREKDTPDRSQRY
jgi:hypothetical protein